MACFVGHSREMVGAGASTAGCASRFSRTSKGSTMGLRRWFVGLLERGAPVETDPESMVEVDVVPLAEGPMYVSGLQREGIDAFGIESYDVVTGTRTRVRVMVRQSDIAAAREILERFR
jgi:hypothetical protein